MPLTVVDEAAVDTQHGKAMQTKNAKGEIVVVTATTEAIKSYGWKKILEAASIMHDEDGGYQVSVTTNDLE